MFILPSSGDQWEDKILLCWAPCSKVETSSTKGPTVGGLSSHQSPEDGSRNNFRNFVVLLKNTFQCVNVQQIFFTTKLCLTVLQQVRFQVLTATSMKMAVYWNVSPCSLVEAYRRFTGACCLHHCPAQHTEDTHIQNYIRMTLLHLTHLLNLFIY
jgi:hypothetical protein